MSKPTRPSPILADSSFNYITQNRTLLIILILFILLFYITTYVFFHLLSHLKSYYNLRSTTPNASSTTPIHPMPELRLDIEIINNMPIFVHGSMLVGARAKEVECPICLGVFEEDEKIKVMPECLHAYHLECLDKWLRKRSSCPLCRSSIDSTAESQIQ